MVTLENIVRQDTKYNFVKNDVEPYVVRGTVQYDMNKKVVDVSGVITDSTNNYVANFNSYGGYNNDVLKCNLTDCDYTKFNEMANLLNETINELVDNQL